VPLPAFDKARSAALGKALTAGLGRPASLFAEQPAQDVEATLLEGRRGRLLLLINWDPARPATVQLRLPGGPGSGRAEGYAILRDASVKNLRSSYSGGRWTVELAPQEARLLRLTQAAGKR
jgi:hypothetical protein